MFLNKLSVRLHVLNIPAATTERTFLSELSFCDDTLDLQDLFRLIDTKLKFLDISSDIPYTVMHTSGNDRFVVDDGYLPLLLQTLFPQLAEDDKTLDHPQHFLDDHVSVSQIPTDGAAMMMLTPSSNLQSPQKQRRASVSFDVELAKQQPTLVSSLPVNSSTPHFPKRTMVPLTLNALNALSGELPLATSPSSPLTPPTNGPILSSSPPVPTTVLTLAAAVEMATRQMEARGANVCLVADAVALVILSMREKRSSTILEIEFCDSTVGPSSRITGATFEAEQVRTLVAQLKANGTELVHVRHVVFARKTERDRQFEVNENPLQLRVTARTTIQVVSLLGTPMIASRHQLVVHDADRPVVRSVSALGGMEGTRANTSIHSRALLPASDRLPSSRPGTTTMAHIAAPPAAPLAAVTTGRAAPQTGPYQNGSSLTVARMGVPSLGSIASGSVSSGASSRGSQPGGQSSAPSGSIKSGSSNGPRTAPSQSVLPYEEPGVRTITTKDVRDRDLQLERFEQVVEANKQKIRHRQPLSTKCAICEFDGESPAASLELLHDRLKKHPRRSGKSVSLPTFEEVMNAVSDKRSLYHVLSTNPMHVTTTTTTGTAPVTPVRYYCKARVADLHTKTLHVVHPRCAHLCTTYQRDQVALEDLSFHKSMSQCDLCGMTGATVACYHPECNEQYHALCAIFSLGYVNFGIRDPALPCPSCPRHVQVFNLLDRLHVDRKGAKRPRDDSRGDEVLFDSAIVEKGDLRDPDDD